MDRLDRVLKGQRVVAAAALVAAWPLAAAVVPLAALAVVTALLGALVAYETVRYADTRAELAAARV